MADFFVSLLTAVLSGLGIGGGGLLVIWLVLFCGTEQLTAQGINLIWFIFSSGAALVVHFIKRRLNFKLIGFILLFGIHGAVLGSLLAKNTDPGIIRTVFGVLLVLSGVTALFKR